MDAADNCFAVHRLALARALSLSSFFFFLMDGALITIKWRDPSALPVFGRLEIYSGAAMADEGRFRSIIANWADTFLSGHRSSRVAFWIIPFFFFLDILILMYF